MIQKFHPGHISRHNYKCPSTEQCIKKMWGVCVCVCVCVCIVDTIYTIYNIYTQWNTTQS